MFSTPSLVGIPEGNASFAVGLEICAITAGNKRYNTIIKKKTEKNHDKIIFLAKIKLSKIKEN